MKKKDS